MAGFLPLSPFNVISTDLLWGTHASTLVALPHIYIVTLTNGATVSYFSSAANFTYSGSAGSELPTGGTYTRVETGTYSGGTWTGATQLNINILAPHPLADVFSDPDAVVLSGSDVLSASRNISILRGYGGDDRFDFGPGTSAFMEIDGGAGHDKITFYSDAIFHDVTSIEEIEFDTGFAYTGSISAADIGNGRFSSALHVTGRDIAVADRLIVNMGGEAFLNIGNFTFSGFSSIDSITIICDADSEAIIGSSQIDIINANGGDDIINGGGGADVLGGGDGSDILVFASGDVVSGESIDGGTGGTNNDRIRTSGIVDFGQASIQSIEQLEFQNLGSGNSASFLVTQIGGPALAVNLAVTGSAQVDELSINTGSATTVNLSPFTFASWSANDIVRITGDNDGENITGSIQSDRIAGGGGIDVINGANGNDEIYGGSGADILTGGSGSDSFVFVGGDFAIGETVDGSTGAGLDRIRLLDSINFAGGTLLSIEEVEFTGLGGPSTATFLANQIGGTGLSPNLGLIGNNLTTDSLVFNMGSQATLNLAGLGFTNWAATDTITVDGDGDVETITGTSQKDTLNGNGAGDTLIGGAAGDTLNGGDGIDTASYANAGAAVIALLLQAGSNAGDAAGDSYISIENLTGSSHNDFLRGDNNANRIDGANGNDSLDGLGGNDTIVGGNGTDTAGYFLAAGGVSVSLSLTGPQNTIGDGIDDLQSIENLYGSQHADTLAGDSNPNDIRADGGNDFVFGAAGNDTLFGWTGNDTINGGLNNDEIYGETGHDVLSGNDGLDIISGGAGFDASVYSDFSGAITWLYNANGLWTITTPGNGTDTVSRTEYLQTSDRPIRLYRLEGEDLAGDFNGDGRDDVLLRNSAGTFETWESTTTGAQGTVRSHATVSYDRLAAGVGDFNGNGTDDILYRNETTGEITFWSMNGTATPTGSIALPLEWHVHAVADFTGNGTDDLLLRNANSQALVVWEMNNFGVGAGGGAVAVVTGTWRLLGTGDFDGDNREDLLWYNSANNALSIWQMNGNAQIGGGIVGVLDATWSVQGIGDFNADGRDDILWRHQSGALSQWWMNGTANTGGGLFAFGVPSTMQVQNVGTYDAGANADILWRDTTTGAVTLWTMNGTTLTSGTTIATPSADWWVV